MTEHTPLPWQHTKHILMDSYGETTIAECRQVDDAEFILAACNTHYDLVKTLKSAEQTIRNFARGDLTGQSKTIAANAAYHIKTVLKEVADLRAEISHITQDG